MWNPKPIILASAENSTDYNTGIQTRRGCYQDGTTYFRQNYIHRGRFSLSRLKWRRKQV